MLVQCTVILATWISTRQIVYLLLRNSNVAVLTRTCIYYDFSSKQVAYKLINIKIQCRKKLLYCKDDNGLHKYHLCDIEIINSPSGWLNQT